MILGSILTEQKDLDENFSKEKDRVLRERMTLISSNRKPI